MSKPEEKPEILVDDPLADALIKSAMETSEEEENIIDEIFITDDDKLVSSNGTIRRALEDGLKQSFGADIHNESNKAGLLDVSKAIVQGSTQSEQELHALDLTETLHANNLVLPPYPPELLESFLEVDPTHYRCVRAKVTDSVGRGYELEPTVNVKPEGEGKSPERVPDAVPQKDVDAELKEIRQFIRNCNEIIGFEGVFERSVMDYEGIGWGAVEVIRSKDMKIRKLAHIPATRVKVLKGWKGFVEVLSHGKFKYYQPFGKKVVSTQRKSPIDGSSESYDPDIDGKLIPNPKIRWNWIDRDTGKTGRSFKKSANEIIWCPKHHSSTIYYGYSDVVPALGQVLANVHIRDFILQYFEHNTVPRYAIIIEGAKLGEKVKEAIMQYFSQHVKGKAHKTLIIPVPAMRGEVKVRFERLDADSQESSFQETRKNNSQIIMTSHGVSPAIIGISDTASLGSGKGLSQAEIYKDRIVSPSQKVWARHINKLLRLGLGITMTALKFNPLDIRDKSAEKDILTAYMDKGALSINQVMRTAGLGEPVEGGDRPFIMGKQGIMFVDELTDATGAEMQAMEDEVEEMKNQMALRDVEDKAKAQAAKEIPSQPRQPPVKPKPNGQQSKPTQK